MFEFTNRWATPVDIAVRKLDIHILGAQLTFVKVLAEGFNPMAKDTGNGLQIISELCEIRADDFRGLQMEDEAELLIHLKDCLSSTEKNEGGHGNSKNNGANDCVNILYKIEAAQIIIARLIERLEDEVKRCDFPSPEVAGAKG